MSDGFEIVFENGSKIKVGTEDDSWRDDPSRLKGMEKSFEWVPAPESSELRIAEGGIERELQLGMLHAAALTARLLPIPVKYESPQFSTPKESNYFYETFRK